MSDSYYAGTWGNWGQWGQEATLSNGGGGMPPSQYTPEAAAQDLRIQPVGDLDSTHPGLFAYTEEIQALIERLLPVQANLEDEILRATGNSPADQHVVRAARTKLKELVQFVTEARAGHTTKYPTDYDYTTWIKYAPVEVPSSPLDEVYPQVPKDVAAYNDLIKQMRVVAANVQSYPKATPPVQPTPEVTGDWTTPLLGGGVGVLLTLGALWWLASRAGGAGGATGPSWSLDSVATTPRRSTSRKSKRKSRKRISTPALMGKIPSVQSMVKG